MIKEETIAHHSANVAYICFILGEENFLYGALVHDTPEVYTGDIPYPFKHQNPALKQFLDAAEEGFLRHNEMYLEIPEEVQQVIKAADMLDLVFKCVDEMQMGNSHVYEMYKTGLAALAVLPLPAGPRAKLDAIIEELDAWLEQTTNKSVEPTTPENSSTGT
jgi:5'-deoxynucleotidase YfbR-like HD superfamily hydrolase